MNFDYTDRTFGTVYTDAGLKDGVATGAFWFRGYYGKLTGSKKFPSIARDSTEAELLAIHFALNSILGRVPFLTTLLIVTDSKSAQSIVWRGTENVKYRDLSQSIQQLSRTHKCKILVKWVKGHKKQNTISSWVNNWCDRKATQARIKH